MNDEIIKMSARMLSYAHHTYSLPHEQFTVLFRNLERDKEDIGNYVVSVKKVSDIDAEFMDNRMEKRGED